MSLPSSGIVRLNATLISTMVEPFSGPLDRSTSPPPEQSSLLPSRRLGLAGSRPSFSAVRSDRDLWVTPQEAYPPPDLPWLIAGRTGRGVDKPLQLDHRGPRDTALIYQCLRRGGWGHYVGPYWGHVCVPFEDTSCIDVHESGHVMSSFVQPLAPKDAT